MSIRPWVVFNLILAAHALRPPIATADDAAKLQFFEARIRPVLVEHCYSCHAADAKILRGGLLLDSREGLQGGGDSGQPCIVAGKPEESSLIAALKHDGLQMPPEKQLAPE